MEDIPLRQRLGTFFILVGLFLFLLFLGAVLGKSGPWAAYFFFSTIALFFGYLLSRRTTPPPPSNRFSGIRKIRENMKKSRAEREKRKQEQKKR